MEKDYKKLYEETLERAKYWAEGKCMNDFYDSPQNVLNFVFPETKESEEEKLSSKLHECVCRAINNDMLPYEERKYISEQVIPYLENLEKQKDQKATWSEEDEDALDIAMRIINNGGDDCAGILDSNKALKWLKSIKERVIHCPQNQQDINKPNDCIGLEDFNVCEGFYIDLGLPSGTLWKDANEEGYYTYDEAMKTFGKQLPTKEQWEELKDKCKWEWKGNGYNITGPNGNMIFLPAAGYRNGTDVYNVGTYGYYCSGTYYKVCFTWLMSFDDEDYDIDVIGRTNSLSVRLVK